MRRIVYAARWLVALAILGMVGAAGIAGASTDPSDPSGAPGSAPGTVPNAVSCNRVPVCTGTSIYNGEAYESATRLWRTNFSAGMLELYDITLCQVVQRCPVPGGIAPSELTLFNGILYHYDFGTGLLYGIDPATCQVVYTCDPPGDNLGEGLTNDGTALWKGDSQNLYRFIPTATAGCQVLSVCPNPPGDAADGLSFCGQHLIMLGYSGTLYEIDPATCAVVGLCPLNAGASGNGISSDRNAQLYADDEVSLRLDRVDVGCDIPVPAFPTTWSHLKVLYR